MGTVQLLIVRIHECLESIVSKSLEKIPTMPTITPSIEDFYVAEEFCYKGKKLILSIVFSPPTREEALKCEYWLLSCDVCSPSEQRALKRPLMFDSIEKIKESIVKQNFKQQIAFDLAEMIEEII